MVMPTDPEPDAWEWTHAPTLQVAGPPAEVHTWPLLTHMAGTEAEAFEVRARQAGREWRASSARLLAARQRLWVQPGPEIRTGMATWERNVGSIVAMQLQVDVLLVPGPDGRYLEYEVLPEKTDRKEG